MRIIAHRAGTDCFPEQSLASVRHSLQLGADIVEVDVRFTSDIAPVISHDENLARVFGPDAEVTHLSLAHFLELRHVADPSMGTYTLAQLFETQLSPLLLHCKAFTPEKLAIVLELICKYGVQESTVLGVERTDAAAQCKAADPRIRVLAFMPHLDDLDTFLDTSCDIIRLWEPWLTPALLSRVHASGKDCWVMACKHLKTGYTSPENLRLWRDMGVDGVLINEVGPTTALLRG